MDRGARKPAAVPANALSENRCRTSWPGATDPQLLDVREHQVGHLPMTPPVCRPQGLRPLGRGDHDGLRTRGQLDLVQTAGPVVPQGDRPGRGQSRET